MYVHFLKHEFFYIFLFSGLLLLFFSAFIKKTIVKLTALILFAVLFVMSMFEMFLYSENKYNLLQFNKPDNFYNIKKRITGYGIKNNKNNEPYYVFRDTKCNHNSDNIYVFLGCSFTFGSGLKYDETLPYFFSKKTNFKNNILNCGLKSRSSNSALNVLKNNCIDEFTDKKNVKHFFYSLIYDHILRNFNLFDCKANDNWVFENNKWKRLKQPFGNIKIIFARSYIFQKIFLPMVEKRNKIFYYNHLLEDLKRIDKIVREKYNSKLTIIVWPDCVSDEYLFNSLQKLNFDIIVLPKYFYDQTYRIKGDNHPNAKANEEIAGILIEHLKKINKI